MPIGDKNPGDQERDPAVGGGGGLSAHSMMQRSGSPLQQAPRKNVGHEGGEREEQRVEQMRAEDGRGDRRSLADDGPPERQNNGVSGGIKGIAPDGCFR